jgi:hypothetical protein
LQDTNENESISPKPPAIPQFFSQPFLLQSSHLGEGGRRRLTTRFFVDSVDADREDEDEDEDDGGLRTGVGFLDSEVEVSFVEEEDFDWKDLVGAVFLEVVEEEVEEVVEAEVEEDVEEEVEEEVEAEVEEEVEELEDVAEGEIEEVEAEDEKLFETAGVTEELVEAEEVETVEEVVEDEELLEEDLTSDLLPDACLFTDVREGNGTEGLATA